MRLLAFIPAFNEEKTVVDVARDIADHCPGVDYVVIDDGSTDQTANVCRENEIPCLSLPVNLGLDGVFQTGMRYAFEHGYDAAVAVDGDGQHEARYLQDLSAKLEEGYDFVVGSRFLSQPKPMTLRMAGSRILSTLFRFATGQAFTDPTSGMRMVRRSLMRRIAYEPNCGPEPDTWQYLVRTGASFAEVPVTMRERDSGESYFTLGRSAFFMLRMIVSMTLISPFRRSAAR